jgi:hypothetical protein
LDTAANVNMSNVIRASQAVAGLLESLFSLTPGAIPIDTVHTQLLFDCFASNVGCSYFATRFGFNFPTAVPVYYPSTFFFDRAVMPTQQLIRFYLMDRLRDTAINSSSLPSCPCASFYDVCLEGKCHKRYAFFHNSFSPALAYQQGRDPIYFDQDESWLQANSWVSIPRSAYAIWVESYWDSTMGARLTSIDSSVHEGLMLLSALLSIFATIGALFVLERFISPKLKMG